MAFDYNVIIAVVGTGASLCSLLIAQPNWKSKAVHVIYTGVLAFTVFAMTSYQSDLSTQLDASNAQIRKMQSISGQAAAILPSMKSYSLDQGANRGKILKALAFLEKHRKEIPDTYETVRSLASNAGLTEDVQPYFEGGSEQQDAIASAASAVTAIVEGLSSGG